MKYIIVTIIFFGSLITTVQASEMENVIGQWQTTTQSSKVRYRLVYMNRYNDIKMVNCQSAFDVEGQKINAVVCDATPSKGQELRFNSSKQTYRILNQGWSTIEVKDDTMVEMSTFGFIKTVWQKADANIEFLLINKSI